MKEERLYIAGYMASGKTTFGRALAERIGWDFLDLDEEVERREGMPAADIIRLKGEAAFRMAESMALKATAGSRHVVVACGGGTPCHRDNMEFMTLHGQTLWLIASPERIAERIMLAQGSRPLADGKTGRELLDFILEHLRGRQPYYAKAMWRFPGEHLENEEEISQSVSRFLEQFPLIQKEKN